MLVNSQPMKNQILNHFLSNYIIINLNYYIFASMLPMSLIKFANSAALLLNYLLNFKNMQVHYLKVLKLIGLYLQGFIIIDTM